ncbi:hypothetical protein EON65_53870 [archaeon]|nr:MAG: hypothetical protein EON65_53870 [archaeon]
MAQDADDEALRRAIEESSQEAMQPKSKTALELADEEALKKAIELSMKEANTGVGAGLACMLRLMIYVAVCCITCMVYATYSI